MTARLCSTIPVTFSEASNRDVIFSKEEDRILKNTKEPREHPPIGEPDRSCETELFFGFFFDGTRNNYMAAESAEDLSYTNVARLYDCFPGMSVPGVLDAGTDWTKDVLRYKNFFRVYIPGVGTPFAQVDDAGAGFMATRGAAFAALGNARIVWAIAQAFNNLNRFFHQEALVTPDEAKRFSMQMDLNKNSLALFKNYGKSRDEPRKEDKKTAENLETLLKRLEKSTTLHRRETISGKPKKIDPAIVTKINISIFGFSRGAAEARTFATWMVALCKRDAEMSFARDFRRKQSLTFGGFPVTFDFMGLFDTVASVGAANTLGNTPGAGLATPFLLDSAGTGHDAWADANVSMRIPSEITAVLHLVAGHEVRRSFPSDSVAVGAALPANCEEIVFPGVHSDVGGGYAPKEQGRGTDFSGADMISRIPLVYMYREARLRGVPLKLELAGMKAQENFKLTTSTIRDFNAYLSHSKGGTDLTSIMREQRRLYIQWRYLRRPGGPAPMENTPSFVRASNGLGYKGAFDANDLKGANQEFGQELAEFEEWLGKRRKNYRGEYQPPGFDNDHLDEWKEIATWWKTPMPLPKEVVHFFDEYVHDSRAWFKLFPRGASGSEDNADDVIATLSQWWRQMQSAKEKFAEGRKRHLERVEALKPYTGESQESFAKRKDQVFKNSVYSRSELPEGGDGLTAEQRKAATEFRRTNKIPSMEANGREPYLGAKAGYLRFRKIYAGDDYVLLSQNESGTSYAAAQTGSQTQSAV